MVVESSSPPPPQSEVRPVVPLELTPKEFDAALASQPHPGRAALATLGRLGRGVWNSIRHDWRKTLLYMVIGGVVAYFGNLALIAILSHGTGAVPSGSPATAPGSKVSGSIFWALALLILCTLISYRLNVGGKQFWRDLRHLPATPVRLFRADGRAALRHLFWGFAVAMLFSLLISPALSGMLAFGFVLIALGLLRGVVTGLLTALWHKLFGPAKPRSNSGPGNSGVSVGLLGVVAALLVTIFASTLTLKLIVAGVAIALAVLLSVRRSHAPYVALGLLVLGMSGLHAFIPPTVLAAPPSPTFGPPSGCVKFDGGWANPVPGEYLIDCGDRSKCASGIVPFNPAVKENCGGEANTPVPKVIPPKKPPSIPLTAGLLGGFFGLGGALLGPGLGRALSKEEQFEIFRRLQMMVWRQQHPCSPWSDFWATYTGPTSPDDPSLLLHQEWMSQISQDLSTGEYQQRVTNMLEGAPAKTWQALQGLVSNVSQTLQAWSQVEPSPGVTGPQQWLNTLAQNLQQSLPTVPAQLDQLQSALASHDSKVAGDIWSSLLGNAEFTAILGAAQTKVVAGLMNLPPLGAIQETVPYFPGNVPGQAALLYAADGTPVAADSLTTVGWRPDQVAAAARIANDYDGVWVVKPGQPDAVMRQVDNPLAKPCGIAAKSANPMDSSIGLGADDQQGFVLFGPPDPPTPPPGLSGQNLTDWQVAAQAQYAKRFSSYFDDYQSMNKAMMEGTNFNIDGQTVNMKIGWEGGGTWTNPATGVTQNFGDKVVYAVVPPDAPTWVQESLGPPGTKVPVPGDNDGFTFIDNRRFTPDGKILPLEALPPEVAASIQANEQAADLASYSQGGIPADQHGGNTVTWVPPTPEKAKVKMCILSSSSTSNPAGQNLIWINGDGTTAVGRWPGYTTDPTAPVSTSTIPAPDPAPPAPPPTMPSSDQLSPDPPPVTAP